MLFNFTVVPKGFYYGTLHYFQIIFVTVPTLIVSKLLSFDPDTRKTLVHLTSRGLSAVLGTGCVAFTFFFARQLFNRSTAILAALFLAVCMGFVTSAHYARVDVPMCFWMMASLLMAARALTLGTRSSYILAGAFAGLAAGVKYVGGITILNLFLAYVLRGKTRDHRGLVYGVLAAAVSFILVNPSIFTASCTFLEGFVVDNAFNGGLGLEHKGGMLRLTMTIYDAVGGPMSVLMGISAVYCIFLLLNRDYRARILFSFPMVLAYLHLLSNSNRPVIDYVLPILPILCIFAGKMISDLIVSQLKLVRWTGFALAAITFVYSALFTVEANLRLTYDSRQLSFMKWVRNYQSFAEDLGVCDGKRPYYQAWFQESRNRLDNQSTEFDRSIEGLEVRSPDVLVVSSFYYDRFKGDSTSPEGQFFAGLFDGRSNYQRVAEFHTSVLPWFDPRPEKINPTVMIFQRPDASFVSPESTSSSM
jgi:hypothetical protein